MNDTTNRFKFRVWDAYKRQWIQDTPDAYMIPNGTVYVGDMDNPPLVKIDSKYVTFSTGLHDKNGKEIYEGDILEIPDNRGNKVLIKVVFDDCCYFGEFLESEATNSTFTVVKYAFGEYEHVDYTIFDENEPLFVIRQFMESDLIEVIGNIHENPELLEGSP